VHLFPWRFYAPPVCSLSAGPAGHIALSGLSRHASELSRLRCLEEKRGRAVGLGLDLAAGSGAARPHRRQASSRPAPPPRRGKEGERAAVAHRDTTRRLPRTEEGVVDGIGERKEQETAIRAKRRPPDSRGGCRGGGGGCRYSRLSRREAAAPADPGGLTLELDAAASSGTTCTTSSAPPTATASSRMKWRPVSAIKPYEGFGDVDHTIKELMSL
jgi:hypothetical protein